MREKGIYSIGDGVSRKDDIKKMFGTHFPKKCYPYEIKLLFLTGAKFLLAFEDEIVECLNHDTKVCLLIASPEKENEEYLIRSSARFTKGSVEYKKEIVDSTLKVIDEIKSETDHPENFVVRFYRDEYQNNMRISKYFIYPSIL